MRRNVEDMLALPYGALAPPPRGTREERGRARVAAHQAAVTRNTILKTSRAHTRNEARRRRRRPDSSEQAQSLHRHTSTSAKPANALNGTTTSNNEAALRLRAPDTPILHHPTSGKPAGPRTTSSPVSTRPPREPAVAQRTPKTQHPIAALQQCGGAASAPAIAPSPSAGSASQESRPTAPKRGHSHAEARSPSPDTTDLYTALRASRSGECPSEGSRGALLRNLVVGIPRFHGRQDRPVQHLLFALYRSGYESFQTCWRLAPDSYFCDCRVERLHRAVGVLCRRVEGAVCASGAP